MKDLLDKLVKEKQTEDKKLKVDDNLNARLDLMIKSFESGFKYYPAHCPFELYGFFVDRIYEKMMFYSQEEIKILPFILVEDQCERGFDELAGLYISALINSSRYNTHRISTKLFTRKISYIGYNNCKNLIVDGDVGFWFACSLREAVVTLNGDCLDFMGDDSQDGEIHLNGKYCGISKTAKAEIYHKDKLIFKDGKPINSKDFEYYAINNLYIPK